MCLCGSVTGLNVKLCLKTDCVSFAAFKNILGNTILIDDLVSANEYRKGVSDGAAAGAVPQHQWLLVVGPLNVVLLTGGADMQNALPPHPHPARRHGLCKGQVWRCTEQNSIRKPISSVWSSLLRSLQGSSETNR